ncbi:MAG: hypothetical protein ACOC2N_06835 [Spirochaetota bacterium]
MAHMHDNETFLRSLYQRTNPSRNGYTARVGRSPIAIADHGDYSAGSISLQDARDRVVADFEQQCETQRRLQDDAVPFARLITGTQLMAHAFGATVEQFPGQMPFARPIASNADEAAAIEQPELESCEPLMRVIELGEMVEAQLGPQTPLGPPDMQTGFDTACLLWEKSDMFVSLYDDQGIRAADQLAARCAGLLLEFISALRSRFPQMSPCHCPSVWCPPELGPWVSNDEAGSIGREHYDRFCHPELEALAARFGSVATHCCADAEHQFERFRETPGWYAFNRVAGLKGYASLLDAFPSVGSDARVSDRNPLFVMGWVSDEDQRMLEDHFGRNGSMIFHRDFETTDDAGRWLEASRDQRPTEM